MLPEKNENHPTEADPFYSPEGGDTGIDPSQYSDLEQVTNILEGYWAAEKDGRALWATLKEKKTAFFEAYERRGLTFINRMSFGAYFGLQGGGNGLSTRWQTQSIQFSGEDGELIEFSVNEMRSFCDQIFNMTTKQRPAFQAQATNTDYASMAQVDSADSMVSYYYEQVLGERKEKEIVKVEGLYGKAYAHIEWDPDGGPEIEVPGEPVPSPSGAGPLPGEPQKVRSGEFVISRCYPWEIFCEPFRSEYDGHWWRGVILPKRSKWEMIARYPIYAQQINESGLEDDPYEYRMPGADPAAKLPEDLCSVHIFYHARTAAMPQGRKCVFVNSIMVDDDELPIDEIPIIPLMSCELHGTSFGISDLWNLMPLEQAQNQVLSDMMTNVEAFGRPPIAIQEGTDVDIDALANGQKIFFIPPGAPTPEAVKFPQVPEISFKILESLRAYKQSITQLNAVARGDTNSSITSGAMAALYTQIAVEAQTPRQLELDLMREKTGNMLLAFLKKYAKHPQMVSIVGVDERAYMDTFTPDDWNGIHRVVIKTANPMLRTQQGRMQLAEILRDWPGQPLKDPAKIIDLITTGRMKPLYNVQRVTDLRIRWENERLLEGPPVQQVPGDPDPMTGQPTMKNTVPTVPVLMTENAAEHIIGHLEVIYSPAARKNPAVLQAALVHVVEHINTAREGDPYTAQLLNNPAPEQQAPAPGGNPNQPGSPNQGKGANGSGPTKGTQVATADVMQDDSGSAKLPKPASPPANAASA